MILTIIFCLENWLLFSSFSSSLHYEPNF